MSTVPLVLREYAGPVRSRPRATWKPLKMADGTLSATVSCPGCGQVSALNSHAIGADGQVSPTLTCPYRCGFHDHIALINWRAS